MGRVMRPSEQRGPADSVADWTYTAKRLAGGDQLGGPAWEQPKPPADFGLILT